MHRYKAMPKTRHTRTCLNSKNSVNDPKRDLLITLEPTLITSTVSGPGKRSSVDRARAEEHHDAIQTSSHACIPREIHRNLLFQAK